LDFHAGDESDKLKTKAMEFAETASDG